MTHVRPRPIDLEPVGTGPVRSNRPKDVVTACRRGTRASATDEAAAPTAALAPALEGVY